MYNIEKKNYGVKLIFQGVIKKDEMTQWVEASKKYLLSQPSKFGVFIDLTKLELLSTEVQLILKNGQKLYKQKGMERSVVILNSLISTMQFKRIAKETGIYQWERYLSVTTANWENIGIQWITNGIDPDK